MATEETGYDLRQLAREAGVTPRTVHFYIQQGLLPPAGSVGPRARYGAAHLARLRLIKRLQREYLPLSEIGRRMEGLSDRQVAGLVSGGEPKPSSPKSKSALEYVRTLLKSGPAQQEAAAAPMSASPEPRTASPEASPDRSQWERIALAPGVELHIRRPLSRARQRQVERLLDGARQLLQEEK
jgi:DNA-binding transcriptional MerR regulator